jgi:retron-type reverse transcriptase
VRQSQKTEQQADRLSRIGLENRKYTRARSTGYGEGKGMSVTIQDLVLDRNNLNQAYLRVKRNKGGPLSPLLANIYLNELDEELTRRGHHFVRYADDCNIYVKSQRAGERVMRSITQFLEKRLKVKVNPDKTKVGSPLR